MTAIRNFKLLVGSDKIQVNGVSTGVRPYVLEVPCRWSLYLRYSKYRRSTMGPPPKRR